MADTKIALIDIEEGFRPVTKLIEAGKVELFPARDASEVEQALVQIGQRANEFHRVVFDSLTFLAERTVTDVMTTSTRLGSIWKNRSSLKGGYDEYGQTATTINLLLGSAMELKNREMQVIMLCHEGEREDPYEGIEMHGPDLQKKILRFINGISDSVFRLTKLQQKGTIDGKEYPAGTRVLRLLDTAKYMAKSRPVTGVKIPELLAEPTMGKITKLFGDAAPRKLVIYGPAGHGKTTLSCSE